MVVQIEVVTKDTLGNFEGKAVSQRLLNAGYNVKRAKVAKVYTVDDESLIPEEIKIIQNLVTNKVTQVSSLDSCFTQEDKAWLIEVGILPGITDPDGDRTKATIEKLLGRKLTGDVYFSQRILFEPSEVTIEERIKELSKLFFNEVTHTANIYSPQKLQQGIKPYVPKVQIKAQDALEEIINLDLPNDELVALSGKNDWALNLDEMLAIKAYYSRDDVKLERQLLGLPAMPTRTEMEIFPQTWSEHCKHKIFNALIEYEDGNGKITTIDSLFKTFIVNSTEEIIRRYGRKDIVSKFTDNAGIIRLNEKWLLAIKCETHNSPSNDAPFGGAATGIVGVYRDILGAGKGAWVISGQYYFVTGLPNYNGVLYLPHLKEPIIGFYPKIHPAELLRGMIDGVQDGGNKSGIATTNGDALFHNSFLGKCLMFASAIGVLPAEINGKPSWEKKAKAGDVIITFGGRVGIDGIHGATVSSLESTEEKKGGHVQIAYPYTQRKEMEAIAELRPYINDITDNGAGGTSSAVGEMARKTGGAIVELDKALLKYFGLKPDQIMVSESQERMTISVSPENRDKVLAILKKHDVEYYEHGYFTNSGRFTATYNGKVVAHLDMDFLHNGVPNMKLKAKWTPQKYDEPQLDDLVDYNGILLQLLSRPNIASKEFITRRFDHEVQGLSVIKPLVGRKRDVNSDATVNKFDIENNVEGYAEADGINPLLSKIDTYHMVANCIDEVVRRLIAVGANPDKIVLNDNFCWPNPIGDEYKTAQLVRANMALNDYTIAFNTPCVSGKDSMSIDGVVVNDKGEKQKVSGLPTTKFLGVGKVDDIKKCITMDAKFHGDLVYVIGLTKDELGASEFYGMLGYTGNSVSKVDAEKAKASYKSLYQAVEQEIVASVHGIYKGGLAVSLAQVAKGGDLGIKVDLSKVPYDGIGQNYRVIFSQSASRLIVTIDPKHKERFEQLMKGHVFAQIGEVTEDKRLSIVDSKGRSIVNLPIDSLREAYKSAFKGW